MRLVANILVIFTMAFVMAHQQMQINAYRNSMEEITARWKKAFNEMAAEARSAIATGHDCAALLKESAGKLTGRLPISNGGYGGRNGHDKKDICTLYTAAALPTFPSGSFCAIVTDAKDEVLHYDGTQLVNGGGTKLLRLRWDGNKWVVVSWWQLQPVTQ